MKTFCVTYDLRCKDKNYQDINKIFEELQGRKKDIANRLDTEITKQTYLYIFAK